MTLRDKQKITALAWKWAEKEPWNAHNEVQNYGSLTIALDDLDVEEVRFRIKDGEELLISREAREKETEFAERRAALMAALADKFPDVIPPLPEQLSIRFHLGTSAEKKRARLESKWVFWFGSLENPATRSVAITEARR